MEPRVLSVGVHFELDEVGNQAIFRRHAKREVVYRVIESLKVIVRPEVSVTPTAMHVLGLATLQLCKAPTVEEIDWVHVVSLAVSINALGSTRLLVS